MTKQRLRACGHPCSKPWVGLGTELPSLPFGDVTHAAVPGFQWTQRAAGTPELGGHGKAHGFLRSRLLLPSIPAGASPPSAPTFYLFLQIWLVSPSSHHGPNMPVPKQRLTDAVHICEANCPTLACDAVISLLGYWSFSRHFYFAYFAPSIFKRQKYTYFFFFGCGFCLFVFSKQTSPFYSSVFSNFLVMVCLLAFIGFYFFIIFLRFCAHVSTGAPGGQERVLDPLELR